MRGAGQQDVEADLIGDILDDLDGDAGCVLDPLGAIGAVGEGELDKGERALLCPQQRAGAIADVGRVSLDHQDAPVGVDHGMALAALDLLAGIPLGAVHRLENVIDIQLYLIEVQCGACVGEDDIKRIADAYNR